MNDLLLSTIRDRYDFIQNRIYQAAHDSGHDPAKIRLVVVTKGHSIDVVNEAIGAGAHLLGENYVEEAVEKLSKVSKSTDIQWHMIGHIQRRKARLVVDNFSLIHSIDNFKLASKISEICRETGKLLPVLLECNMTGEATKFGWECWDKSTWPVFVDQVSELCNLPGIQINGLMTMAPYSEEPELARPAFRRLSQLRNFLGGQIQAVNWNELSMGMSGDYEVAIQEGATMLRIGTAIVGSRNR